MKGANSVLAVTISSIDRWIAKAQNMEELLEQAEKDYDETQDDNKRLANLSLHDATELTELIHRATSREKRKRRI